MFEFVEKHQTAIKVILGTLVVAFIGIAINSGMSSNQDSSSPVLAKVGSRNIRVSDLQLPANNGTANDQAISKQMLAAKVFENLWIEEAEKQNIFPSKELVAKHVQKLLLSPEIKEQLTQAGISESKLEEFIRNDIKSKFSLDFLQQVGSRPSKTREQFIDQHLTQERLVSRVVLNPEMFKSKINIQESAIKTYWNANKNKYFTPEQAEINYVVLEGQKISLANPSEDAIKAAFEQNKAQMEQRSLAHILMIPDEKNSKDTLRKKLDTLRAELLQNPNKFSELAKKYSQDPGSKDQGGSLGKVGRGIMVPAFEQAAFALKQKNEISPVIESDFGLHIIQLQEVYPPNLTEVRPQIVEYIKDQERRKGTAYQAALDKLYDSVSSTNDLQKVASDNGLAIQKSPGPMPIDGLANLLQLKPETRQEVLHSDVLQGKKLSKVVELPNQTAIVIQVMNYKPKRQQNFEEVKTSIEDELKYQEAQKLSEKTGQEWLKILKDGKTPEGWNGWPQPQKVSRQMLMGNVEPSEISAIFEGNLAPKFSGSKLMDGSYAMYHILSIEKNSSTDKVSDDPQIQKASSIIDKRLMANAYLNYLKQTFKVELTQAVK
jgi:peptidyl-prolyl cis-trans isomerase D